MHEVLYHAFRSTVGVRIVRDKSRHGSKFCTDSRLLCTLVYFSGSDPHPPQSTPGDTTGPIEDEIGDHHALLF